MPVSNALFPFQYLRDLAELKSDEKFGALVLKGCDKGFGRISNDDDDIGVASLAAEAKAHLCRILAKALLDYPVIAFGQTEARRTDRLLEPCDLSVRIDRQLIYKVANRFAGRLDANHDDCLGLCDSFGR